MANGITLSVLSHGRDLRKLNSRAGEPFRKRPHMIRQLRQHGWCSILVSIRPQRPHWPAEVVTVHGEERDGAMNPPVLREAVGLPRLPRIAVAVRALVHPS